MESSRRILMVTQVYPPDPTAVGQYMAEVAEELVAQGHQVLVLTADRGYDDPTVRLPRRENRAGVDVLRLPFTSFGKKSILIRLLGGFSLVGQAIAVGLFGKKFDSVLLTTSPPLGGAVGVTLNVLRGLPFYFWLMDLNPDQTVELGKARPESVSVKAFDALNRQILRRARAILALDSAMAERFARKLAGVKPVEVLPLWPLKESRQPTESGVSSFLSEHGLHGKRVIMHSGNHSIAHPLETLFEAVKRTSDTSRLRFLFVGGGLAKKPIEAWVKEQQPTNVQCLPYQPIEQLGDVLGASTVQVVVVGEKTVGIVHPSKIYGAIAAAKPILVIGPVQSPAAQLVLKEGIGWHVEHGDVDGLLAILEEIEATSDEELGKLGERARALANGAYARTTLLDRMNRTIAQSF